MATVDGNTAGSSLSGFAIDYQETDVTGVSRSDIDTIGIDKSGDDSGDHIDVDASDDLGSVSISDGGSRLELTFGGNYDLASGDEIVLVFEGATNPSSDGDYTVTLAINPSSANEQATATLTIQSATPTPTLTPTPTPTPSPTPTATPTPTPTPTATATPTPTPTATPTPAPAVAATSTPTPTSSTGGTATATETAPATPTRSPTATQSPTPTEGNATGAAAATQTDSPATTESGSFLPMLAALGVGLPLVGLVGMAAFLFVGRETELEVVSVEATPPYPGTVAMYSVTIRPESAVDHIEDLVIEIDTDEISFPSISAADARAHIERTDGDTFGASISNVLPGSNQLLVTLKEAQELDAGDELTITIDALPTPSAGEHDVDIELNASEEGGELPTATLEIVPDGSANTG
ncbi:hypothetical protein [Natronomonas sp.]|uniref:hypothetical protein n=1 Tax=Natronomonas sp. TaxID=2184060 RepID=UPI003989265C